MAKVTATNFTVTLKLARHEAEMLHDFMLRGVLWNDEEEGSPGKVAMDIEEALCDAGVRGAGIRIVSKGDPSVNYPKWGRD